MAQVTAAAKRVTKLYYANLLRGDEKQYIIGLQGNVNYYHTLAENTEQQLDCLALRYKKLSLENDTTKEENSKLKELFKYRQQGVSTAGEVLALEQSKLGNTIGILSVNVGQLTSFLGHCANTATTIVQALAKVGDAATTARQAGDDIGYTNLAAGSYGEVIYGLDNNISIPALYSNEGLVAPLSPSSSSIFSDGEWAALIADFPKSTEELELDLLRERDEPEITVPTKRVRWGPVTEKTIPTYHSSSSSSSINEEPKRTCSCVCNYCVGNEDCLCACNNCNCGVGELQDGNSGCVAEDCASNFSA